MERVISLFREPQDEYSSALEVPAQPGEQKADESEPLYFQQLLEYLRSRDFEDDSKAGGD